MSTSSVWQEFSADPRDRANASLRASDADRDVIRRVLADGVRRGHGWTGTSSTSGWTPPGWRALLGDLPPLIDDLVPTAAASTTPGAGGDPAARGRPVGEAASGGGLAFLSASTLCWAIWLVVALTGDGTTSPGRCS